MKVRTRFAPSPTGFLHIGGLRTALYAYALAKNAGGDFILRIEDTDQKREVKGATEALQTTLKKFGLNWDEFYVQSERQKQGLYQKAAEKLVDEGHAFYCDCKAKNAKAEGYSTELRDPCRDKGLSAGAIKLKVVDGEKISYTDFVHRKKIEWDTSTVYDATLLKSDGFPTYHLAVAVDDIAMQITHIIRGHDWLPSTPVHLLVFKYLGGPTPEIGHPTDILSSETGKKLSKRRDSVFVEQFLDEGYLPAALLNFVILLGWAPKDNREIYTLSEFVEAFTITGFQSANPRFFRNKLDWINGQYIQNLSDAEFVQEAKRFAPEKLSQNTFSELVPLLKTRIKKFSDLTDMLAFFVKRPEVKTSLFKGDWRTQVEKAKDAIEKVSNWQIEKLNTSLMEVVEKNAYKTGEFFMNLRIAVSGQVVTPPINESIIALGKDETLARLNAVVK